MEGPLQWGRAAGSGGEARGNPRLTGGIPLSFAGVAGEGGYSTNSYIRHRTNLTKGARNLAKLRKVPRNERYSTVHM